MASLNPFNLDWPGKWTLTEELDGVSYKGGVVLFENTLSDALKFIEKARPPHDQQGLNAREFCLHVYKAGDLSFKGGTFQDLLKPYSDFRLYREMGKSIRAHKAIKRLAFKLGEQEKPKRQLSAYDGDYDHDRRFDFLPFAGRERRGSISRIIQLNAECSVSCQVSVESINKYAAFVAGLISILEQCGFVVGLNCTFSSINHVGDIENTAFRHTLRVKKPSEYLPPGQLLKAMSPVFYRRYDFGVITAGAEVLGGEVSSGLGQPLASGKKWEIRDGEIFIYACPSYDEQHKIADDLLKLVGKQEDSPKEEADIPF